MDPSGKVALVTGGASGIGLSCAEQLLERGAQVSICDCDPEKGNRVAAELQKKFPGSRVLFTKCDITNEAEFEEAFKITQEQLGPVEILLNNAGILDDTKWQQMVDINVKGTIRGTLLGLKYMGKDNGGCGGVIVNMASISGLQPYSVIPLYGATKHAIVGLTRAFGLEAHYKYSNVRVVAMCPSTTTTAIGVGIESKLIVSKDVIQDYKKDRIPYHQSPLSVAKGVLYVIENAETGTAWVSQDDKPITKAQFISY